MLRRAHPGGFPSRHLLRATLALIGAGVVLLGAPLPAPRGEVLDLVSTDAIDTPIANGGLGAVSPPGPSASPHLVEQAEPVAPAAAPLPDERDATSRPGRPPSRLMAEATGPTAPPLGTLTGYVWPIAKGRLTLPFGPTEWGSRWVDGARFHDGMDLATFCGDRVRAAHAGTVLAAGRRYDEFVGWVGDVGPYLERIERKNLWLTLPIVVVIDDGNGYRSIYAHFRDVVVKPGQRVDAGQLIGHEGMTGRASGCHLHYSLFSPWEDATMAIRRDVVRKTKMPAAEVARVDPLLVLPPRRHVDEPGVQEGPRSTTPDPEAFPPSPH